MSDDTLRQRVLTGWEAQVGTTLASIESQARGAMCVGTRCGCTLCDTGLECGQ